MAGSKMLFSLALLIGSAAAGSPCDIAPPVPVPVPGPAPSPCTTAPPLTCATFACPANSVPKGGLILCGNKGGPHCCAKTCCTVVTTVTTTPAVTVTTTPGTTVTTTPGTTVTTTPGTTVTTTPRPSAPPCTTVTTTPGTTVTTTPGTTVTTTPALTCKGFVCPDGWKLFGDDVVCAAGKCDKTTCCKNLPPPCTTVTTTPSPTCSSFTCPDGFKANAGDTVCGMGKCNTATCCSVIITTVTTTPPPPTCASYTCPKGYATGAAVCAASGCTKAKCCTLIPTVPPCAVQTVHVPVTVTTTPYTPPAPASPCGTVAPRLYEAKEMEAAPKDESNGLASLAFPLFGVVAMFSFAAFVGVRVHRNRSTRQVQLVPQEDAIDEESFLSDATLLE